jgi:hypothetical protein
LEDEIDPEEEEEGADDDDDGAEDAEEEEAVDGATDAVGEEDAGGWFELFGLGCVLEVVFIPRIASKSGVSVSWFSTITATATTPSGGDIVTAETPLIVPA